MTSVADNQGIAFALPISTEFIGTLLSSIEMYQSIARPLIGIEYVDITPALKAEKKLSVDQGIFVTAALS
jgi:S1-C subfamily serine protease